MDITPIVIIGIIFGSIVAIILGPTYLKSRERQETQATVRAAIERGQPLPSEVIDAMTRDVKKALPSRTRDIRQGIIWLAVGVGIAAFSLISDLGGDHWDGGIDNGLLGVAAIPATIGLAFVVLSFFNKNKD